MHVLRLGFTFWREGFGKTFAVFEKFKLSKMKTPEMKSSNTKRRQKVKITLNRKKIDSPTSGFNENLFSKK